MKSSISIKNRINKVFTDLRVLHSNNSLKKTSVGIFIGTLFITANFFDKPRYLSVSRGARGSVYMMKYYLAIKRSKLQIHATLWINLNAGSHTQDFIHMYHCMIPFIWSPTISKLCLWWKKIRIVVVGAGVWRWTRKEQAELLQWWKYFPRIARSSSCKAQWMQC